MAYPTLDDTWIFKVNQSYPSTGSARTDNWQVQYAMKNELVDTTGWTDASGAPTTQSNPWTVAQSCGKVGGTTWTADTADNWDSRLAVESELYSPHSWIALTHPSFNQVATVPPVGFTCLIDMDFQNYQSYYCNIYFCPHGYSNDGTTMSRPTPRTVAASLGDGAEYGLFSTTQWMTNDETTVFDLIVHTMCTTDGKKWRQFLCHGGEVKSYWGVDQLINPQGNVEVATRAWWPGSYAMFMYGNYSGQLDNDELLTSMALAQMRTTDGTWVFHRAVAMALWEYDNNMVNRIASANELTNEWPMDRVHIYGSRGGLRGYAGRLSDLWVTNDTGTLASGTTFNSGAFAVFGGIVVPWNTSVPVLS